jgi:hypothetical protein
MAGVPSAEGLRVSINEEYPKPLKAFSQFVLLPLVVIYLGILYAYAVRIVIDQAWPQGLVSWLVFGFAIAGILAFLLLWPLRSASGTRWVRTFTRLFYVALLPLIFLEAAALYKRVDAYGFTEERIVLLVLTLWLAGITLAGLVTSGRMIRLIPASLVVVLVLITVVAAPIGVRSQQARVKLWLDAHGMLKNGTIVPPLNKKEIPSEEYSDFESQLSYLNQRDALDQTLGAFYPAGQIPMLKRVQQEQVSMFGNSYSTYKTTVSEWLDTLNINAGKESIVVIQPFSVSTIEQGAPLETRGARYIIQATYIKGDSVLIELPNREHVRLTDNEKLRCITVSFKDTVQTISLIPYLESKETNDSIIEQQRYIPVQLPGIKGYYYLARVNNDNPASKTPILSWDIYLLLQ